MATINDAVREMYLNQTGRAADPGGLEYFANRFGTSIEPDELAIFRQMAADEVAGQEARQAAAQQAAAAEAARVLAAQQAAAANQAAIAGAIIARGPPQYNPVVVQPFPKIEPYMIPPAPRPITTDCRRDPVLTGNVTCTSR